MGITVTIKAIDDSPSTKELKTLEVTPVFFSPKDNVVLAAIKVVGPDGKLLQRAMLTLSGSSGLLQLRDFTVPVEPQFVRKNDSSAETP
jgi:hypothetical protein